MGTFIQYMYTYKHTYIICIFSSIPTEEEYSLLILVCMYVCMYVQRIQLHLGLSQIPVHLYAVHRRAVSLSGEHGAQGQ